MIIPDDDVLMAYVDGELTPVQAKALEAAMATDPGLAAAVQRHRALRDGLRDAYAPVLEEAVPEHLAALLRPSPPVQQGGNVVPLVRPADTGSPARWGWPQGLGMAASMLLGVALSQWAMQPEPASLQAGKDGGLIASGALARGLQEQLASRPEPGAMVAVGLTFRDRGGRYCRSFVIREANRWAGLGCRQADGRWQVPVVMAADIGTADAMRQAASALPPGLLAEIEARMHGDALDVEAEQEARDAGWR